MLDGGSKLESAISGWLQAFPLRVDENEYWQRMWTVQELALARNPLILYENGLLPAFRQHGFHGSQPLPATGKSYQMDYPVELSWAVRNFNDLKCSDPRDRLFALKSLLVPEQAEAIMVDYEKSPLNLLLSLLSDLGTGMTERYLEFWIESLCMALCFDHVVFCHHKMLDYLETTSTPRADLERLEDDVAADEAVFHILFRASAGGADQKPCEDYHYTTSRCDALTDRRCGPCMAPPLGRLQALAIYGEGWEERYKDYVILDSLQPRDIAINYNDPIHISYRLRKPSQRNETFPTLDLDFSNVHIDVDHLFEDQRERTGLDASATERAKTKLRNSLEIARAKRSEAGYCSATYPHKHLAHE